MKDARVTLKIKNILTSGEPLVIKNLPYSEAMGIIKHYRSWTMSFDRAEAAVSPETPKKSRYYPFSPIF